MIRNKIVLAVLFIDFAALNLYAAYADGPLGWVEMVANGSPWMWVLAADLVIALSLIVSFMFAEAKKHGDGAPIGWAIATFLTGSIAPLLYLFRRPEKA